MEKRIQEIEDYLIEEFGSYLDQLGSKALLGRIFGYLLSQTEPVSLTRIAERLQVSKPAVSTTIKIGLQVHFVKKIYRPEFPREDFYGVGADFMEMMTDPGIKKLRTLSDKIKYAVKMLNDKQSDDTTNEFEILKNRIYKLEIGFDIIVEEYREFGRRVRERMSVLKSKK